MNPKTIKGLNALIASEQAKVRAAGTGREGYDAAGKLITNVAVAAFNYACAAEEATGFQASWASLQFLASVRDLKGPFAIVSAERMLYPQHATPTTEAAKWEAEWRPWLGDEARKLLSEHKRNEVSPVVWAHWERLSADPTESDAPRREETKP